MKLRIEPSWHQAIVGMTGSGKTTLLKAMVQSYATLLNRRNTPYYYKIYILDTKHYGDFDGFGTHYDSLVDVLQDVSSRIIVYEPNELEDNHVHYEAFIKALWERWLIDPKDKRKRRVPTVIVVDELTQLEVRGASKSYIDPDRTHYWAEVMKRGRASKFVLWNATQNPVRVPEDFFRNADAFFAFRLSNPDDRKRISRYMGDAELVERPILDPHGFWYYHSGMMKPFYFKGLPT